PRRRAPIGRARRGARARRAGARTALRPGPPARRGHRRRARAAPRRRGGRHAARDGDVRDSRRGGPRGHAAGAGLVSDGSWVAPAPVRSIRAAFTFLTRIPVGGFPYRPEDWAWSAAHFPLVGLVLGAGLAALYALLARGLG